MLCLCWFVMFSCVVVFLEAVVCYVCLCVYVCFDCKCKSLKRLGENIQQQHKETYTTYKLKENNKHTTETQDIQPTNLHE